MGNVLFMRKGEIHEEPSNYDPVFANNTWEQIIEACQKNKVPETWAVGDSKPMKISGTDYQIDIIGKNHDEYVYGSGIAPLTFQMHDLYGAYYHMNTSNTNSGGWANCRMKTTILENALNWMPNEVKASIRRVNKLTSAGSQSNTIITTTDQLFLLSEVEIFGTASCTKSGEGKQYDYYKSGNGVIKSKNGSADFWWGRSPLANSSASFFYITSNGSPTGNGAGNTSGLSFAFCF